MFVPLTHRGVVLASGIVIAVVVISGSVVALRGRTSSVPIAEQHPLSAREKEELLISLAVEAGSSTALQERAAVVESLGGETEIPQQERLRVIEMLK